MDHQELKNKSFFGIHQFLKNQIFVSSNFKVFFSKIKNRLIPTFSPLLEACKLLSIFIQSNIRTMVFCKTRRFCEIITSKFHQKFPGFFFKKKNPSLSHIFF